MKNIVITLCFTVSLALASLGVGWSDGLQKGFDVHKKGDYATALKEWKFLAEGGNATAQHYLGIIYS